MAHPRFIGVHSPAGKGTVIRDVCPPAFARPHQGIQAQLFTPIRVMSLVRERARQVWPGLANDLQSTYQLANAILGSGPKAGPAKLGHTFLRREGIPTVRDHADAGKEH